MTNPIVLQPGFMDEAIIGKDGVPFTDAERDEYWEDVFSQGIPMSMAGAIWLYEKWSKRLRLKDPRPKGTT